MSHTRIVEVTVTETVTRQAHLRINSDYAIDEATLANPEVVNLLEQMGEQVACEKDSGLEYTIELIEPDQEQRYRFSIDSHLDISCLDPADSMAG